MHVGSANNFVNIYCTARCTLTWYYFESQDKQCKANRGRERKECV